MIPFLYRYAILHAGLCSVGEGALRRLKMRRQTCKTNKLLFDNSDTEKRSGSIIRKPGSKMLYVLFYYCGKRIEKSTGLVDSPNNREKVRKWLDRQMGRIEDGIFNYSEAFPTASESEKMLIARLEGGAYLPSPKYVSIGEYIEKWDAEIVENYTSDVKRTDFRAIISCWIKPYFSEKTFYELTRYEVQKFIGTFKLKIGKKKGDHLSKSRSKNIISVLRTLFNDAADEYHWENIQDPFRDANKHIPDTPAQEREIFRFDEWIKILAEIPQWHRPMIEMMMLTGMIHSEISGLLRSHIRSDHIFVQQSIVRKVESRTLKTRYRIRKLPITKRIREILDVVLARTDSPYVFAKPDGTPYLRENFTERTWTATIAKCDIPYRPPYSIRHSFAAWSLLVGVEPLRLVKLMGHGSKKMVYEVYGDYVEDLERDFWDIVNYFGRDYMDVKKRPLPYYQLLSGESFGESQGAEGHNQLIMLNN